MHLTKDIPVPLLYNYHLSPKPESISLLENRTFIHNSPKLKTIEMPTSTWLNKQFVVYSYSGILLTKKKKSDAQNMREESKSHKDEWKEPDKMVMYCISPLTWSPTIATTILRRWEIRTVTIYVSAWASRQVVKACSSQHPAMSTGSR